MSNAPIAPQSTKPTDSERYRCYLTDGSTESGPHRHNVWEIVFVLSGRCNVSIRNGEPTTVCKGTILPISSADYHEFTPIEGGDCQMYVAHIDGYLLPNSTTGKFIQTAGTPLLCPSDVAFEQIRSEFEWLHSEIRDNTDTPERDAIILNIVSRLCLLTSRIFFGQIPNADSMDREILVALAYINEYFQHPLSLDEVAEHVGLSRFRFSRLFHQSLHVTFQDHLLEKRLRYAYRILETSDTSVTETAEQAGFHSRSYFCRKFKDRFGLTPREVQKKSGEQTP